jgi:hypothetical protein
MDDAFAVGAVERVADLDRDRQRFSHWNHRRSTQPIRERLAFEILEHQVVEVSVAADVVNGTDVRIVQRGNDPRFVLEALPRFRIGRERAGEHLDGNRAIETGVTRAIDLAHAARAKRGDDFVRTKTRACFERHADACILAATRGTGR